MSKEADKIVVSGIRCYGYTGYLPEEQALGQWFEVDLVLWKDLSAAGRSDELEDTIDYGETIRAVKQSVQQSKFKLIEALAEAIAILALQTSKAGRVRVSLTKLNPPIPDFSGRVSVAITRP
ncbi:dihydroneopterin aldolase [Synechococcus sp. PCC 7336]|uniref:dihydroneopterin aldolase n=1 Tax=Synechococcus sp. PCC 7336 TaxID=195250 RepID=UPI000346B66C|nr:dihydroneopterin aldolase [Synechococcus sp. PCC 7336]